MRSFVGSVSRFKEVTQQGAWKINDDTRGELTHSPLSPSLIRDDHTRVLFLKFILV